MKPTFLRILLAVLITCTASVGRLGQAANLDDESKYQQNRQSTPEPAQANTNPGASKTAESKPPVQTYVSVSTARKRPLSCDDAISALDAQLDTVLGKEKRVLALINDVSTWYTINPTHPSALAASADLRRFWSECKREANNEGPLYEAVITSCAKVKTSAKYSPLVEKLNRSAAQIRLITSQGRELTAMGFDFAGQQ